MARTLLYFSLLTMVSMPIETLAEPTAFREGQFSLGLAGGGGPGGFGIGLDVGYLVKDGFEVSLGASYWALQDTNLFRVTPGIRYIFVQLEAFMPYVGGFARRWFFTDDAYKDVTSVGTRAGIHLRAQNAMLGLGVAYEKLLDCQDEFDDECTSIYPEFSLSILF